MKSLKRKNGLSGNFADHMDFFSNKSHFEKKIFFYAFKECNLPGKNKFSGGKIQSMILNPLYKNWTHAILEKLDMTQIFFSFSNF